MRWFSSYVVLYFLSFLLSQVKEIMKKAFWYFCN
jgi:hypothetical protein